MPACLSTEPGSHEPPGHYMPAGIACPLALLARWHRMPASTTCPLVLLTRWHYMPANIMCPLASSQHSLAMNPLASQNDPIVMSPLVTPTRKAPRQPRRNVYEVFFSNHPVTTLSVEPPRIKKRERQNSKMGTRKGTIFWAPRFPFPLIYFQWTPAGGSKNGPVFEIRGFVFFQTLVPIFRRPGVRKFTPVMHTFKPS